ncbi:hypothetical protein OUZ56_026851 [Daphnia magna]|uniref:Uncharacterized protein n=1 Tax=Daphnia magna TaxID=35525 RepID=A0ABQ9ZN05_9CRUS|nr:hypothetical protein OUZ56_026851 [Daphnia magna]
MIRYLFSPSFFFDNSRGFLERSMSYNGIFGTRSPSSKNNKCGRCASIHLLQVKVFIGHGYKKKRNGESLDSKGMSSVAVPSGLLDECRRRKIDRKERERKEEEYRGKRRDENERTKQVKGPTNEKRSGTEKETKRKT